jgi:hypothetical protein
VCLFVVRNPSTFRRKVSLPVSRQRGFLFGLFLMIVAISCPEILVELFPSTRRYGPDLTLHSHRCEKLRSKIKKTTFLNFSEKSNLSKCKRIKFFPCIIMHHVMKMYGKWRYSHGSRQNLNSTVWEGGGQPDFFVDLCFSRLRIFARFALEF